MNSDQIRKSRECAFNAFKKWNIEKRSPHKSATSPKAIPKMETWIKGNKQLETEWLTSLRACFLHVNIVKHKADWETDLYTCPQNTDNRSYDIQTLHPFGEYGVTQLAHNVQCLIETDFQTGKVKIKIGFCPYKPEAGEALFLLREHGEAVPYSIAAGIFLSTYKINMDHFWRMIDFKGTDLEKLFHYTT